MSFALSEIIESLSKQTYVSDNKNDNKNILELLEQINEFLNTHEFSKYDELIWIKNTLQNDIESTKKIINTIQNEQLNYITTQLKDTVKTDQTVYNAQSLPYFIKAIVETLNIIKDLHPVSLIDSQLWYMNRMNALDYKIDEGHCYGLTIMALQAFLVNEMKTFNQRLQTIYHIPIEDFENDFENLRKKQEKLIKEGRTEEAKEINRNIVDILAFFDSVALHQNPQIEDYSELFSGKVVRQDASKTMPILMPLALDTPETTPVMTNRFSGAYDKQELMIYLESLQKHLGDQHSFSLRLISSAHAINLNYDHTLKRWILIDPNHLPGEEYIHADLLSDALLYDFKQTNAQGLVMETSLFTTTKHAQAIRNAFVKMEESPKWKAIHTISKDKIYKTYAGYIAAVKIRDQLWYAILRKDHDWIINAHNVDDSVMQTALKMTFDLGSTYLDFMDILIKNGAKPNEAMFLLSCVREQYDVAELLIQHGIQPTEDMFQLACRNNKIEIAKFLIDKLQPTKNMLESACEIGNFEIVKLLIDRHVKPTQEMLEIASSLCDTVKRDNLVDLLKNELTTQEENNPRTMMARFKQALNLLGISDIKQSSREKETSSDNDKIELPPLKKSPPKK